MSDSERIRRAFLIFHLILGFALLWGSVHTLLHLGPFGPAPRLPEPRGQTEELARFLSGEITGRRAVHHEHDHPIH